MITYNINSEVKKLPKELKNKGNFKDAKRVRRLDINPNLYDFDALNIGDHIVLELFADKVISAHIHNKYIDINGSKVIRCHLDEYEYSYCTIIITDQHASIKVDIVNEPSIITTKIDTNTGVSYLVETELSKTDKRPDSPGVPIPDNNTNFFLSDNIALGLGVDDPTTIDLLIVYTPAAKLWADTNEGSINNTIADAIEACNTASVNSALGITFVLKYSAEVDYIEIDAGTDLDNLTGGSIPTVHDLRDTYCCDMVVMMTDEDNAGGLGWLNTNKNGSPDYAYSITRVQQASWTYTTVHEIGHNIGCGHHAAQNFQAGPTGWTNWPENTYSAGWRWKGNDNQYYCSVMTYEEGTYFSDGIDHLRVPVFSNPNTTYAGVATGDIALANNTRTIKEMKHIVSAYRICDDEPPIEIGYPCTEDTLNIGDLCWQKCNLDVATYANGDLIRELTSLADYNDATSKQEGAWCYYDFDSVNQEYGRLYNQYAVLDSRGLADNGWRVASDDDWKNLSITLGMSSADADVDGTPCGEGSNIAYALREIGFDHWSDDNGTDVIGFSALAAGWYGSDTPNAAFADIKNHAEWWTSTPDWHRHIVVESQSICRETRLQLYMFSIRLCMDCGYEPPCGDLVEARYVAPKEYFSLSNWWTNSRQLHGNTLNPIFTFWGSEPTVNGLGIVDTEPQLQIHIYPNNTVDLNRPPGTVNVPDKTDLYYIEPDIPPDGFLEYYYTPTFQNDTNTIYIPYEFEEMLILGFIVRLLMKLQDSTLMVRYNTQLQQERLETIKFIQEKKETRTRSLDSFVDPVIPMVAPQGLSNEAQVSKVE